jgi:hypothetical protein
MARIEVECIAEFRPDYIRPMRIRYEDNEGAHVIRIDKIISKDAKKIRPTMNISSEIEFSFKCENIEEGIRKYFTLVYNNQLCKWHMLI